MSPTLVVVAIFASFAIGGWLMFQKYRYLRRFLNEKKKGPPA